MIRSKAIAVRRAFSEDTLQVLEKRVPPATIPVQPGNVTAPTMGAAVLSKLSEKTRQRLKSKKPR